MPKTGPGRSKKFLTFYKKKFPNKKVKLRYDVSDYKRAVVTQHMQREWDKWVDKAAVRFFKLYSAELRKIAKGLPK